MNAQRRYLSILGIGNIYMQDDGFGVNFITWFGRRYAMPETVQLIEGGALGYGLFDIVTNCEHLIVIDTINIQDEPGSLYRFTMDDIDFVCPLSSMAGETAFTDVLFKAELIDRLPQTTFLCIVPQQYQIMGTAMSAVMHQRFPHMAQLLFKELAALNIAPERITTEKQLYCSMGEANADTAGT